MKIAYETWRPGTDVATDVARAAQIAQEYARQGYDLTLRQLYYQFVSRDWIPNTERSYKRLGDIVNRARMAGYIDWDHMVDRTRNLAGLSHWADAAAIIRSARNSFHTAWWEDQPTRIEVWVEKEALAGVIERVASRWDCDWFSCRGYVSQSEMWSAGQRLANYIRGGQRVVILHLGDHDPSGIDMSRDINDRLTKFITHEFFDVDDGDYVDLLDCSFWDAAGVPPISDDDDWNPVFRVERIALNMDQIRQYQPPPNPAKITDSRAEGYIERFGSQSWELDALDPRTLDALVEEHITGIVDLDLLEAQQARQAQIKDALSELAAKPWDEVMAWLDASAPNN